jgi:hypothetical protein
MYLYRLGTFKNNEDETSFHELLQKQKTDVYQDGIFKPVPRQKQIHPCAHGLCDKRMTLEWNNELNLMLQ